MNTAVPRVDVAPLKRMRRLCARWSVLLLAAMCLAQSSRADDYGQVQQLQSMGQTTAALEAADRYIDAHPGDPQMRFIKANVLGAAGRTQDAEALLQQLTREYPELAEPWNNLAVLYAAQGRLDEAQEALVAALRAQPDYATALENLGDVRTREALRAYERARALDAANPRLAPKIEALQRMTTGAAAR